METIFTCGEVGSFVYCMIFTCPIILFLFYIFRKAGWRQYLPDL